MRKWARRSWLGLGLILCTCGCSRQDADRLARIGRVTADRLHGVAGATPDRMANGWQGARAAVALSALDARVALRLRWDSRLADRDIHVHITAPGVVHLEGTVADNAQHRRALEIARTTQGVQSVVDDLLLEDEGT
jgi:osmotically-inducible protein OsmY